MDRRSAGKVFQKHSCVFSRSIVADPFDVQTNVVDNSVDSLKKSCACRGFTNRCEVTSVSVLIHSNVADCRPPRHLVNRWFEKCSHSVGKLWREVKGGFVMPHIIAVGDFDAR